MLERIKYILLYYRLFDIDLTSTGAYAMIILLSIDTMVF